MTEQKNTNVVPIKKGNKPAPDKLTGKQSAFVRAILKGLSQSDAYRAAYDCTNMADNSIWREASVLFANPKVTGRIKALQARQEDAALLSGLATRQHIQRTLYGLTKKGENDAAKLRACELLGKLSDVAAFTERVAQVPDDMTPEEITQELTTKLKAAFGEL
jgi:hypothetical protein